MSKKVIDIKEKKKAQGILNPPSKRLFTIEEAGKYLGRSKYSVRTLIWDGQLRIVKNGKKMWIDVMDMDSWILDNKTEYQPLPGKKKIKC